MKLKIRNNQPRSVPFNITDRPTEVKTMSIGAQPNFIPPNSALIFNIFEGEDIVLAVDGGISIVKEDIDA